MAYIRHKLTLQAQGFSSVAAVVSCYCFITVAAVIVLGLGALFLLFVLLLRKITSLACVLVVMSCVELLRSCGLNNLVEFRHPCVLIRLQTIPTTKNIELATIVLSKGSKPFMRDLTRAATSPKVLLCSS